MTVTLSDALGDSLCPTLRDLADSVRQVRVLRDSSISAAVAGLVAVLVGYTSSVALIFSAARALGGDDRQVASTLLGLCVAMATVMLVLSLRWRQPVMIAWSTPGAAVIATAATASGFRLKEAIGAYVVCAGAILIVGATGWFGVLMRHIPGAVAAALLAGVLARFAMDGFAGAGVKPLLVISMLVTYVVSRQFLPRYAVVITSGVGIVLAVVRGNASMRGLDWSIARPVFTAPSWSAAAMVSIAVPVFVVTMAGQNLPGVAAIRSAGYDTNVNKVITFTGLVSIPTAFVGAFAVNLAAITAAICLGPEAHPDKERRYVATVTCALTYLVVGLFGAAVAGLLTALGQELVHAIAALALVGTIGASLTSAVADERNREAAVVTFLVTLSGVTLVKVGSAFWGAAAGLLVLIAVAVRARLRPTHSASA